MDYYYFNNHTTTGSVSCSKDKMCVCALNTNSCSKCPKIIILLVLATVLVNVAQIAILPMEMIKLVLIK